MKKPKEIKEVLDLLIESQEWLQSPQYDHVITVIDTLNWVLNTGDQALFEDIINAVKDAKPKDKI